MNWLRKLLSSKEKDINCETITLSKPSKGVFHYHYNFPTGCTGVEKVLETLEEYTRLYSCPMSVVCNVLTVNRGRECKVLEIMDFTITLFKHSQNIEVITYGVHDGTPYMRAKSKTRSVYQSEETEKKVLIDNVMKVQDKICPTPHITTEVRSHLETLTLDELYRRLDGQ